MSSTFTAIVCRRERLKEAIEVFGLNAVEFPVACNTWDPGRSLHDQQARLAMKYYRKVLDLHPGDSNQLKRLGDIAVPRAGGMIFIDTMVPNLDDALSV